MDVAALTGTMLALFTLFGGALMEGLSIGDLIVVTSGLIVFVGTWSATLLSFPLNDVTRAVGRLSLIYGSVDQNLKPVIDEVVAVANIVRKDGILALEAKRSAIKDPLLKKTIKFVIEGVDAKSVNEILENEIDLELKKDESAAKVWEVAGGYAPTLGLIGGVLSLMFVMKTLDETAEIAPQLGHGLSVSLVAVVYGLVLSKLVFIPWSLKLKCKGTQALLKKQIVKTGVLGILEGLNPGFLKEKLDGMAQKSGNV